MHRFRRLNQESRNPAWLEHRVIPPISERFVLLILALAAGSRPLLAEPQSGSYHVESWLADKGLPQSTVTAVAQASDGFLWIGTQNGLARFDGARFNVFDEVNVPEIKNSRIVQLFADREGSLWIGAEKGTLVRLKDGKFSAYTLPGRGTTYNYVRAFCEDGDGALWLNTCEWQLIRLANDQFSVPSTNWNLSGTRAQAVTADAAGRVWVGTDKELAVRQKGVFDTVFSQSNEPNFAVEFLAPRREGGCWVAANGRLRRTDAGDRLGDVAPYQWTNSPVYGLFEDSNDCLWVATFGSGLFRYDTNGSVLHLTTKDGLPSDSVRCVMEDHEGDVWVGAEDGGLCRLGLALFETIGPEQGLASAQVMSVCEGNDELWIGSNGNGLDSWRRGVVKHYGPESGLGNGHVWSVLQDLQGVVWAGTWEGLYRNAGNGFTGVSDGSTVGWETLALYEDSHGDLCVGQQAFNGFTRINGSNRTVVTIPGASTSLDIRSMIEDPSGAFWIGTADDGLFRMKEGQFRRFGKADGLRSDAIWCLHIDQQGFLWVGTSRGGLSLWRDGHFVSWTTQEGLPNNVICQILEDDDGNLWLGSYGGVFRVRKDELLRGAETGSMRAQCRRYGLEDGLPSLECQGGFQPSGCRTRDGRLWFPTVKGLAVVDPKHVSKNPVAPPVLMEETLLDGGVAASALAGGKAALKIPPGTRRIEFHYTALSFAAPNEVQFKYKLEGFEDNWIDAGNQRAATYSHLPAGTYHFHVIACNSDGVWNEEGASLAVVASPYFWETGWFFALATAAVIGVVAALARGAEARKMRRRVELAERERAVEQERARIARDMHDSLGANLTEIAMLSELAQNPEARPEQAASDINRISTRARELTRSLDEIVWAINPRNDTMENFVSYTCNFAENYLRLARIACRLDVPERLPDVTLGTNVRHNLFLVVKEAVNNIVKHAGASEVWIKISASPGNLAVAIEDNGKGFAAPSANGNGRPGDDVPHNGPAPRNGLVNMRHRMETIGGRFFAQSQPGRGAQLLLEIELRN